MLLFLLLATVAFQIVSSQYAFTLVTTPMSWDAAYTYCKNNHRGLADILSLGDLTGVGLAAIQTAWIGLHYNATTKGLTWSSGLPYLGASWMPDLNPFLFLSGTCATMFTIILLPSSCSQQLPFICSYAITGSSTGSPANTQLPPVTVTGNTPTVTSQGAAITSSSTGSPANTQLPPVTVTGNTPTATSQGADTGYMILKVDFLSPGLIDLEAMKKQLLNEVEEILIGSFPKGSFQLKWIKYEQ